MFGTLLEISMAIYNNVCQGGSGLSKAKTIWALGDTPLFHASVIFNNGRNVLWIRIEQMTNS